MVAYLKDALKRGKRYFKARHIGQDLGISPKAVGQNMAMLAQTYKKLRILRWGYSSSTTWLVELR